MKISIIGTGYVGLVTGIGFASYGHKVICVDIDREKVKEINKGKLPIYEKGLDKLLEKALSKKLFSATTDLKSAVLGTGITFITVPTPSKKNGEIDLSYVKKISKKIGSLISFKKDYHTVVVKSTVIPGTCLKIVFPLLQKGSMKKAGKFGLCMNPEFLREGQAVDDFMNPDRIVIGELNKKSGDSLVKIYKNFHAEIFRASLQNAEMIKYTNNALLATLISFSNEIADICERIEGANISQILKGVYLDKRLTPIIKNKRIVPGILNYISPGCGFGGSCFPKDMRALVSFSAKKGHSPNLLSAVLDINRRRPSHLVNLAEKELGNLSGKKIAVLGLVFKPDTDDIRESPAISIIKELISKKTIVSVYDPLINPKNINNLKNIKSIFENLKCHFCSSLREAVKGKDACLLITPWEEFKKITPEFLKKEMRNPLLIDGRNFFNAEYFGRKIKYIGIGLGEKSKINNFKK